MSDVMMPGGAPTPPEPPATPGNQIPRSVFNPQDLAVMGQGMGADMSVGDFLQKTLGISPEDPVTKLVEALKGQVKTSSMDGKIQAMKEQSPPAPSEQPGVAGLMNRLRG